MQRHVRGGSADHDAGAVVGARDDDGGGRLNSIYDR